MKPDKNSFIVVTRTKFDSSVREQLLELAHRSRPIFLKQPGCLSYITHMNTDLTETMTYMEWATEEDHINCMKSQDFADVNPHWQALFESGNASIEFGTYTVLGG